MTRSDSHYDCLVVGGGVIGLSIADELATAGVRVGLIERNTPGREASWAGAGILPPGSSYSADPALESLARFCRPLHGALSDRIRERTRIDDGLHTRGGVYLAVSEQQAAGVHEMMNRWANLGIRRDAISPEQVVELAPGLCPAFAQRAAKHAAYHVPDEAQVRNPRRIKGLMALCRAAGVDLLLNNRPTGITEEPGHVRLAMESGRELTADHVCFSVGAWSDACLKLAGQSGRVRPIRGQMLLLEEPPASRSLGPNVHCGSHYALSRDDGRTIVGTSVEDAGFNKSTTTEVLAKLLAFAKEVGLGELQLVQSWAGLRPASDDGLPLIGRAPGYDRVVFATGHFRAGLQFAPGTAILVRELLLGQSPSLDLSPFRLDR